MPQPKQKLVLILDFGSQVTQLIARRVREIGVYSEIHPYTLTLAQIKALDPSAVILSGGPASVHAKGSPKPDPGIFSLGLPILGICYGMQLMAHLLGGVVRSANSREYGDAIVEIKDPGLLFHGLGAREKVWMSHGDHVEKLPVGFKALAKTKASVAAMADEKRRFYSLQFHPEVVHTARGMNMLRNFLVRVADIKPSWSMAGLRRQKVQAIRAQVGQGRVLLGLSGGVDSSVAALLLHEALGKQLTCCFVDNGLLRKGEAEEVETMFRKRYKLDLRVAKAAPLFLKRLQGVEDPEKKRKIIGATFIEIFEKEARKVGKFEFLAQGTLYPDVIESVSVKGPSAVIKSHHNVGGLPMNMRFKLVEPLRELFKDEVRSLGETLGLPESFVWRHPFPGPGAAIRCLGEVTKPKLALLREADAIVTEEIRAAGLYRKLWQAFAVLLPVRSVGVMGDERTYEFTCAVRCVTSTDAMTADWADIPRPVLARISSRIINEVRGINRVVYDISSKPPATIEWE